MKTVFQSASQVIHLFAQQVQDNARSGNCYFEKTKIYSYGRHYLLGEFITNKQGNKSLIINDSGYSNTTAKHISELRQGTRQYLTFNLTEIAPIKVLRQLETLKAKLIKAKKPEIYLNQANQLLDNFTDFQKWIESGLEFSEFNYDSKFSNKDIIKEIKKISLFFNTDNNKELILKAKNQLEQHKKSVQTIGGKIHLLDVHLWINNIKKEDSPEWQKITDKEFKLYCEFINGHDKEDYLRINGDQVETSQGVKIDLCEAKKLYTLISQGKDIKGYKIGYYTVISLNGVLQIGCHKINVENMHKIGKQIINS